MTSRFFHQILLILHTDGTPLRQLSFRAGKKKNLIYYSSNYQPDGPHFLVLSPVGMSLRPGWGARSYFIHYYDCIINTQCTFCRIPTSVHRSGRPTGGVCLHQPCLTSTWTIFLHQLGARGTSFVIGNVLLIHLMHADESPSNAGLQQLLNICFDYGILYNARTSMVMQN